MRRISRGPRGHKARSAEEAASGLTSRSALARQIRCHCRHIKSLSITVTFDWIPISVVPSNRPRRSNIISSNNFRSLVSRSGTTGPLPPLGLAGYPAGTPSRAREGTLSVSEILSRASLFELRASHDNPSRARPARLHTEVLGRLVAQVVRLRTLLRGAGRRTHPPQSARPGRSCCRRVDARHGSDDVFDPGHQCIRC
jgi:hypothetical protein